MSPGQVAPDAPFGRGGGEELHARSNKKNRENVSEEQYARNPRNDTGEDEKAVGVVKAASCAWSYSYDGSPERTGSGGHPSDPTSASVLARYA